MPPQQPQQQGWLLGILLNRQVRTCLLGVATAMIWIGVGSCMGTRGGPLFAAASGTASAVASSKSSEVIAVAISSAWAGLAAGCLHTLAGADHLAALTPLTVGVTHFKASLLGALWGFGHSMGQLILGLMMVLFKDRFEALVPTLTRFGGTTVGVILVAIGVFGLLEGMGIGHDHHHDHHHDHEQLSAVGGGAGAAAVAASPAATNKDAGSFKFATFATGVVYGLHPDALFVVIPALTLPTKLAAAAYILMFVLGTITAMGSYTLVIGATSKAIEERNAWLASKLSSVASLVALCVGGTILAGEFGVNLPFSLTLFGGSGH